MIAYIVRVLAGSISLIVGTAALCYTVVYILTAMYNISALLYCVLLYILYVAPVCTCDLRLSIVQCFFNRCSMLCEFAQILISNDSGSNMMITVLRNYGLLMQRLCQYGDLYCYEISSQQIHFRQPLQIS